MQARPALLPPAEDDLSKLDITLLVVLLGVRKAGSIAILDHGLKLVVKVREDSTVQGLASSALPLPQSADALRARWTLEPHLGARCICH
jgi:hypothetical protein